MENRAPTDALRPYCPAYSPLIVKRHTDIRESLIITGPYVECGIALIVKKIFIAYVLPSFPMQSFFNLSMSNISGACSFASSSILLKWRILILKGLRLGGTKLNIHSIYGHNHLY